MSRMFLFGWIALAAAAGCGSDGDKTVIPSVIKKPPGDDSPGGPKGIAPKAAPDAAKGTSSADK